MKNRTPRLTARLTALVGALALSTGGPARGQAAPVAAARTKPVPFKVMSFNIRFGTANDGKNAWPLRAHRVVQAIRSFHPDVLGLQEALPFQVAEIRVALPEYEVISRDRDGTGRGETCAIFVRSARFSVRGSDTFWLSPTPDQVASKGWDTSLPRICTWVSLRDRRTGHRIRFANTHFDHRGPKARLKSARMIAAWLQNSRPATPLGRTYQILVGDLNADEFKPPIVALRDAGLRDAFRVKHPNAKAAGTFSGFRKPSKAKIDYVWCNDALKVHAAGIDRRKIDGGYPSDHFPVTATLSVPDAPIPPERTSLRLQPEGPPALLATPPYLGGLRRQETRLGAHGLTRTTDGWRLWAIAQGTEVGDVLVSFSGAHLGQRHWHRTGPLFRVRTDYGENSGNEANQARFFGLSPVSIGRRHHLLFGGGRTARGAQQICLATQTRPDGFERHRDALGRSQVFADLGARDPHVLRVGPTFYCVYLAARSRREPESTAVFVRTSADLIQWSERMRIWDGGEGITAHSPSVIAREGSFFLLLTQAGAAQPTTLVYRSTDPLKFPKDPTQPPLPLAYPEIVEEHGRDFITGAAKGGILIQRLRWRD